MKTKQPKEIKAFERFCKTYLLPDEELIWKHYDKTIICKVIMEDDKVILKTIIKEVEE